MTSRRLLDPVAKTLLDAADLIEARGWWDGCGDEPERGALCADMAIGEAADAVPEHYQCYIASHNRFTDYLGIDTIPPWNDSHTKSEVIAALRAAAVAVG